MQLLSNSFTGTIPSCIGNLTNLATLDISYNKFTGTIPNQIGLLTKLQYLILEYNSLNYTIPNDISTLSKLYSIYLNNNQLSGIYSCYIIVWVFLINRLLFLVYLYIGTIPTYLGNSSLLSFLMLDNNKLIGTIPRDVAMFPHINVMHFQNNKLSMYIITYI